MTRRAARDAMAPVGAGGRARAPLAPLLLALALLACGDGDDAARRAVDEDSIAARAGGADGDSAQRDTSALARGSDCAAPPVAGTVRAYPVSDGTRGMITVVRWASSPDGCALLVVEDPVSVEAEPAVDRALYAHERGALARVDSAWDVQPDRGWRRLAVGRAHVAQGRDASDTLPTSAWLALSRATGRPLYDVRSAAFAASGMTIAYAVAQPIVVDLDSLAVDSTPRPARGRALPVLGGWRVRWSEDGGMLAVGAGPRRAGDDEPPLTWLLTDAASGRPIEGAELGALPASGWSEDLLLDASAALDPSVGNTIPVRGGRVVGDTGRIVLVRDGSARVDVGRGTPLAATTNGRVILALAPRRSGPEERRSGRLPYEIVLYVVR